MFLSLGGIGERWGVGGELEMELRGREGKWGDVVKDGNRGCLVRIVVLRMVFVKCSLWWKRVMG